MEYTMICKEEINISRELIEEILEREIPDELYKKYEDDFIHTINDHLYIDECIQNVLKDHSNELYKLESEVV